MNYFLFSFYYLNYKAKNRSNFILEIILKVKNLIIFIQKMTLVTSKKKIKPLL